MESQTDRAHGHGEGQIHEQEPHHTFGRQTVVEEDQDENHHEKKSVMMKVKAQAKKIKDTLKKHGYGHDHHEQIPDEHDLDEEEDLVEDPQFHGAPIVTGKSTGMDIDPLPPNLKPLSHVQGPEGAKEQQSVTLGSTTVTDEVPHAPLNTPVPHNAPGIPQTGDSVPTRTGMGDVPGDVPVSHNPPGIHLSRDNVTGRTVMGDLPHAPQSIPVPLDPPGIRYSEDNVSSSTGLGSDVHDPPGVHLSKDNDPSRAFVPSSTGLGSDVHDRPGIHLSGDNDPSRTFVYGQEDRPGQPKVNLERPKGLEEDPPALKDTPGAYAASNYQTKVTDPTGKDVAGGEEAGITSVLHSFDKLNVDDEPEGKTRKEHKSYDQFSPELTPPKSVAAQKTFDGTKAQEHLHDEAADRPSSQGSSYASAIADKAISAKNVVATKLGYGKKDDTRGRETHEGVEGPTNQGGYTDKISSATSDKPISAKNVVASNLGYGEKDNTATGGHEMRPQGEGEKNSTTATAVDYEKKVASTVTDKVAPVYEKVAGAGSAETSKIPGTGTHTDNQQRSGVEGQGKGVSVKNYFAEKLRPGEEDRALSEVISGALHKRKPEQATRPVKEVISDAVHKRNEEADEVTNRPMGKVTESEEVGRRLGTFKDNHDQSVGNKGMVDKIKGTVGSWLGKGDQSQESGIGSAGHDAGHDSNISEETRLHEN